MTYDIMWTRAENGLGTTTYPTRSALFRSTELVALELGLRWEDLALVWECWA